MRAVIKLQLLPGGERCPDHVFFNKELFSNKKQQVEWCLVKGFLVHSHQNGQFNGAFKARLLNSVSLFSDIFVHRKNLCHILLKRKPNFAWHESPDCSLWYGMVWFVSTSFAFFKFFVQCCYDQKINLFFSDTSWGIKNRFLRADIEPSFLIPLLEFLFFTENLHPCISWTSNTHGLVLPTRPPRDDGT